MRKVVALVVLIVLLGGFGVEVGARAYRLRQCNRYAKVVRGMAQERDGGVSSDVMRARLKATEAAQTEPDPGIHDLMESTITGIYGHPELTPDQCAAVALDGCPTFLHEAYPPFPTKARGDRGASLSRVETTAGHSRSSSSLIEATPSQKNR